MTGQFFKGLLFFTILFSAGYAFAGLEIVGDYNYASVSPSDLGTLNKSNISASFPSYSTNTGFGGDVRYVFPVYKLLVGGRYESWSMTQSLGATTQTVPTSRGAILLGYRFIDTVAYLGVIGSYGVTNTMKVTTTSFIDLVPAST